MTLPDLLAAPAAVRFFGLAGAGSAALGALAAGLAYRGRQGERYSIFNHFISELGEVGVSRRAWAFNLGLIACGLLLLPCALGLGLLIDGVWAKLGMAAGACAALSVALVGAYPMNRLTPHICAAMSYFRCGLAMVLLFSIAIAAQPQPAALPRLVSLLGAPAVLSFAAFLAYARVRPSGAGVKDGAQSGQHPLAPLLAARPRFWTLAVLEWAVFLTTVPWLLAVALLISPV